MKLTLTNFQAHKSSTLEVEGLTVITGESNAGKSSIIRGLLWLLTNKPTGTSFIRYGQKGATVQFNDIVRERDGKWNRYVINDCNNNGLQYFDAIKTDVPESIEKNLNLCPANIQRQRDTDFLIGLTPTTAGELLDSSLYLASISKVEVEAAGQKRAIDGQCRQAEAEVKRLQEDLEKYAWLDVALPIEDKRKVLESNKVSWETTIRQSQYLIDSIKKHEDNLKDLAWIPKAVEAIEEYKKLQESISVVEKNIALAQKLVKDATTALEDLSWIPKILEAIEKYRNVVLEYDKAGNEFMAARKQINIILANETAIEKTRKDLEIARKQLPKLCPTCGQPWSPK